MRGWRNPPKAGKLADLAASGGRTTLMVTVYVIVGRENFRYIGITENLRRRLREHNSGKSFSTKARMPYKLVLAEKFPDYVTAREREKFLKSGIGRKFLDGLQS